MSPFPLVYSELLDSEPVSIIDPRITGIFHMFENDDQCRLVSRLEDFIEEIKADGSIMHLLQLGALWCGNMHHWRFKKDQLLERSCWQLAEFYRQSTPSRISEAVPTVRFLACVCKRLSPDSTADVLPRLYLGVALSRSRKNDEEAVNILMQALHATREIPNVCKPYKLWSWAELSPLLRRLGRVAEAEEEETKIRQWIKDRALKLSEIRKLISDDPDGGVGYIFAHQNMSDLYKDFRTTEQ